MIFVSSFVNASLCCVVDTLWTLSCSAKKGTFQFNRTVREKRGVRCEAARGGLKKRGGTRDRATEGLVKKDRGERDGAREES